MEYFDEILNVDAYLRMRMQRNLQRSQEIAEGYEKINNDINELTGRADAAFMQIQELARQLGVDISEQEKRYADAAEWAITEGYGSCADLRIKIPKDYDYEAAFQRLLQEAHKAGFTDVHPEQLLTEEELRNARAYDAALDRHFEAQTELTGKDMEVVMIGAAIRILCYAGLRMLHDKNATQERENRGIILGKPGHSKPINARKSDAARDTIRNFSDLLKQGKALAAMDKKDAGRGSARSVNEILHTPLPFDIPDNQFFKHSEIAGYNKFAGWILGVLNIITNTVTTLRLKSYSIIAAPTENNRIQVNKKISFLFHVLLPAIGHFSSHMETVLAAVAREAEALKIKSASLEDMSMIFDYVTHYKKEDLKGIPVKMVFGGAAAGELLNQLITAIHSAFYNPKTDGDIKMYAVRTNRVLLLSSGIAAAVNSMPAILTENDEDIDWGGGFTTVLNAFNSVNFWIEIKSQYLVSEYKKEIDKQMAILDQYIEFV